MKMIRQRSGRHDDLPSPDAIQLEAMAERGELETPVHWEHELLFAEEAAAREAERRITDAGWSQDWLSAQPASGSGWLLRAGRDAVLSREEVAAARAFFEALCATVGGSYAGWDVRRVPKHLGN